MGNLIADITTIIINHKTSDLLRACVESFRAHYTQAPLLLIDNGSADESTDYIRRFAGRSTDVQCILNETNLFHGPAMDQGIRRCTTPFVFLLDSDCLVLETGFLEQMRELLLHQSVYAVGRLQHKNRFGFDVPIDRQGAIPYVDPHAMLLKKSSYLKLPPFTHHGAPCLENMKEARRQQQRIEVFSIEQFVQHLGRGTSNRYGYGLGWQTGLLGWLHRIVSRS